MTSGCCWSCVLTKAVVLAAMASGRRLCASVEASLKKLSTRMRFSVSVPVLSVQMTVIAPIVSQACIRRTRLLLRIMLRML